MKPLIARTAKLVSADPTITVPDEVHLFQSGRAVACHADHGDVEYPTLDRLAEAYRLDEKEIRKLAGEWPHGRKPQNATERAAMANAMADREKQCFDRHPGGWRCTLPPGHPGDHVAGSRKVVYAAWEDGV